MKCVETDSAGNRFPFTIRHWSSLLSLPEFEGLELVLIPGFMSGKKNFSLSKYLS